MPFCRILVSAEYEWCFCDIYIYIYIYARAVWIDYGVAVANCIVIGKPTYSVTESVKHQPETIESKKVA